MFLTYKNYFILSCKICQAFLHKNINIFCQSFRKVDKSMFETFEKIKMLAKNQGISLQKIAEDLGFSTNYLYSLKNKKAPSAEHIAKIADYFGVSTDYLLGRSENPNHASSDQVNQTTPLNVEELADNVMMFGGRELTEEKKKVIQSIIEAYLKETND